jgi:hypothetical protein
MPLIANSDRVYSKPYQDTSPSIWDALAVMPASLEEVFETSLNHQNRVKVWDNGIKSGKLPVLRSQIPVLLAVITGSIKNTQPDNVTGCTAKGSSH